MSDESGPQAQPPTVGAELPDRVRLPVDFDPIRMQEDLARLGEADWTAHFVPAHYQGEWDVLPLRAPAGASHPILRIVANPGIAAWEPTQWLQASPYFRAVLASFRCQIRGARLMRLSAGSVIHEHRDERLGAEWGQARLHIPVTSSEDVEFRLNGVRVKMAPGETWYLRLSEPHSVVNRGSAKRVHLVIDAVVNRWLKALLLKGAEFSA